MIRIQCSMLEQVRRNPLAYGQLLAANDKRNGGGTHGMFAYWQDVVKQVHLGEMDISKGLKVLKSKFLLFDENSRNQKKQEFLIEQFIKYCRLYDKMKFEFITSKKQIKWPLSSQTMLTGLTPWVVKDSKSFYSFFPLEQHIHWKQELKYPLLQEYLSKNVIECPTNELHVGIYCLQTTSFDFKAFSSSEIKNAIGETKGIFQVVENGYNMKKPLSK